MNKILILENLINNEIHKDRISSFSFLKRFLLFPNMFLHTIQCFLLRKLNINKFVFTKTFWGRKMLVVLPEVVSSDIYRFGFIEANVARSIIKFVSKNDVVIDVGAHFGFFTILMAEIVGSKGEVHSFEPIPSTFNVLKRNADFCQNIKINKQAIWRNNDHLYLNDYGLNASAFNSYRDSRGVSNKVKNRVKVRAINLDEYIKKNNITPKFIKIDAESTEYEVLEGMKFILENIKPVICLEIGDLGVEGVRKSKNVIEYVLNYGYEAFEFNNQLLCPHKLRENYSYGNLLLKHPKSKDMINK